MNVWFKPILLSATVLLLSACTLPFTHDQAKEKEATPAKTQKGKAPETKGNTTPNKSSEGTSNTTTDENQTSTTDPNAIQVVGDPTSVTVLVNKTHKLPDGYIPPDLVYPNVNFPYADKIEKREMRAVAAKALEKMFAAASKDGITLYAQSGYRSYVTQKSVFDASVQREGLKKTEVAVAIPGTSEHQTGLAIDLTSPAVNDDVVQAYANTPDGQWVANNAHVYGFIIRYPDGKQSITGYEYEPWHIRYVGADVATYIYEHHLTLEQYLAQKGK
ncbi:MAG TPA: M15 family metallopeptidase [Candidatus Angelobacter sp.]|nr:M15 family metallopeptidase [Candidatus Angelobacter sp.]